MTKGRLLDIDGLNQKYLDIYYTWLYKRHEIWINRFVKNLPQEEWTDDPILKSFKFTNAYRELDLGTLYYTEVMIPQFRNRVETLINTVFYKLFNYIGTIIDVGLIPYHNDERPDWMKILEILDKRFENKQQILPNAHLVHWMTWHKNSSKEDLERYHSDNKYARMIKAFEREFSPRVEEFVDMFDNTKSFKECYDVCNKLYRGAGPFISYEILVHLWMSHFYMQDYSINDFANPGPGALRFLHALIGGPLSEVDMDYNYACDLLNMLREEQNEHFDRLGLKFHGPELHLLNIENACCECSKYIRALEDVGRPKLYFKLDENGGNTYYMSVLNKNKNRLTEFYKEN